VNKKVILLDEDNDKYVSYVSKRSVSKKNSHKSVSFVETVQVREISITGNHIASNIFKEFSIPLHNYKTMENNFEELEMNYQHQYTTESDNETQQDESIDQQLSSFVDGNQKNIGQLVEN
jgi:ribosomal protein L16 Arg81 hydroxylase